MTFPSGDPLSDKCWHLLLSHWSSDARGKFFFMSGETLQKLKEQRAKAQGVSAAEIGDYLYGVRIMVDDTLAADVIKLRPFRSEAP